MRWILSGMHTHRHRRFPEGRDPPIASKTFATTFEALGNTPGRSLRKTVRTRTTSFICDAQVSFFVAEDGETEGS